MELNDGISPDAPQPPDPRVRKVELFISGLLRVGVVASLSVIVVGLLLTFLHHPEYAHSPSELHRLTSPGAAFPRTIGQVIDGVREARGQAVVIVGLLLLVATPVMRVAVTIIAFAYEKDRAFVVITSVVFCLLVLSFVLGNVEG